MDDATRTYCRCAPRRPERFPQANFYSSSINRPDRAVVDFLRRIFCGWLTAGAGFLRVAIARSFSLPTQPPTKLLPPLGYYRELLPGLDCENWLQMVATSTPSNRSHSAERDSRVPSKWNVRCMCVYASSGPKFNAGERVSSS